MSEKEKLEWDLYPNHPLTCISWEDVNQKIIPAFKARGFQVRMMTDAEAEYLMRLQGKERVITATDFPWGDDPSQLGEYGWYLENSRRAVLDVKTALKTSSEGLYDTRGNVDSWVKDWWMNESTKGPIENPQGPEFGFFRIVRGGSFDSTSRRLSSKERGCKVPEYRSNSVSVRLVIE
jgi:formylglycine-generating enzyme required for sulfatase activity